MVALSQRRQEFAGIQRLLPMGNTPSSLAGKHKDPQSAMTDASEGRPIQHPPEAVHLDFDNMPFLQPPQTSRPASEYLVYPGSPLPPATSPPNIGAHSESFGHQATFVQSHTQRVPSEGRIDHTVHDLDFFDTSAGHEAEIVIDHGAQAIPRRSHSSSITSQLSVLSQRKSPNGSPHGSPRSHRHSFMQRFPSGQYEMVDAGVPPPVPPHFTFPEYISPKHNSETETALAVVDALEDDIDPHSDRRPLQSRSRSLSRSKSLSRSLTRRKSLGSESVVSGKSMTTEIYTRKCSSPTLRSPETPGSLASSKSSETDDSIQEPESPAYDDDTSFSLEGYHEGTTKLRVVNLDKDGLYLDDAAMRGSAATTGTTGTTGQYHHHRRHSSQKHFVKSKAQLAEEEEQRIRALRKRYERYGHTYRVKEAT